LGTRDTVYFELVEALAEGGCPICRLAAKRVAGYLDALLYEHVNDPGLRHETRRSQGFCQRHAQELVELGDGLGVALIYRDIVEALTKRLKGFRPRRLHPLSPRRVLGPLPAAERLAEELAPEARCPACQMEEEAEKRYVGALVKHLAEPDFLASYRGSSGLCLGHFQRALRLARSEEALATLVEGQAQVLERLDGELAEFIRKHDYRFQDEGFGEERDSWIRVVEKMVGTRSEAQRATYLQKPPRWKEK